MTRAALFLDRDDTIVRDLGYIGNPDQITLLPGVADALRKAAAAFRLYLVTNQSGIGRGYYTLAEAEACNRRTLELLELPPPGFTASASPPKDPTSPRATASPPPPTCSNGSRPTASTPPAATSSATNAPTLNAASRRRRAILVGLPDGNYRPRRARLRTRPRRALFSRSSRGHRPCSGHRNAPPNPMRR